MFRFLLKIALVKKLYDRWRNRDKPHSSGV
jgi:hypothetical protein